MNWHCTLAHCELAAPALTQPPPLGRAPPKAPFPVVRFAGSRGVGPNVLGQGRPRAWVTGYKRASIAVTYSVPKQSDCQCRSLHCTTVVLPASSRPHERERYQIMLPQSQQMLTGAGSGREL